MLKWLTTSSLGTIQTGYVSEISVQSTQTSSVSELKYELKSGLLPSGLTLKHDGTIVGRTNYNSSGTFTFIINAVDLANTEESTQTFTLNVTQPNNIKYTSIYIKPFLSIAKRNQFNDFINDSTIFNPSLMYRYYDLNFGVQRSIKLTLDFGIEQLNLYEYQYALQENFYKKKIRLGGIKSAIAKNSAGTHVYDIVYVEVVDELVNNSNVSVSSVVHTEHNDELYYPASIDNMRKQLQSITLQNWSTISVDENLQPRFMLTQQANDYRTKTYIRVIPLCYTLPNKSRIVLNKIKSSNFKFNTVDFEVDRIVVENSLDNSGAKYLIFNRNAVGDLMDIDGYLFGPEGWVRLDDENNQPLQRE